MADVLAGKRLQVLKESIPKLSHVAVLWNPSSSDNQPQWKESQLAARQLGLQLHSMEVSTIDQYESAFKGAIKARSAALAVSRHRLFTNYQKQIAELAAKYHLPAIHFREDFVERGGLMSYGAVQQARKCRRRRAYVYGVHLPDLDGRAAIYVDKILKGTKPADLPVEQPTKFEFVINLKTAKQIGLTIPPNVLARADRVIR